MAARKTKKTPTKTRAPRERLDLFDEKKILKGADVLDALKGMGANPNDFRRHYPVGRSGLRRPNEVETEAVQQFIKDNDFESLMTTLETKSRSTAMGVIARVLMREQREES